jgi:hypothetical protein
MVIVRGRKSRPETIAEQERVNEIGRIGCRVGQGRDQHAADEADRVGLEHVRRHARAVADVVAHIIGNRRGVAGIVFVKVLLDLADEVRADVRSLGIDAAAETGED